MEKTTIRLNSNIMLKSRYDRDKYAYLPYDLLPDGYSDVRAQNMLSPYQREQQLKSMFVASAIMDEDTEE